MLFKALNNLKKIMTLNNPKQSHLKTIPLQIQSWGTIDFLVDCTLKKCKNLSLFDTAERSSVVMHHGYEIFNLKICCLRHCKILNKITLKLRNNFTLKTYRCKLGHGLQETFFGRLHTKIILENFVFLIQLKNVQ
jgi:hypothetical protein